MNIVRYNYETRAFSLVEVRLFTHADNDKPPQGKIWTFNEYESKRNDGNLMRAYKQVKKDTWKRFTEFCNRNHLTPKNDPIDTSNNNNSRNNNNGGGNGGGGDNYGNTNAAGVTRSEGTGIYDRRKLFKTDFDPKKMNARKYATVRLLKERLNEMIEDNFIEDVLEDGNYNYVVRIRKTNSLGHRSLDPNYIYVGIYVIDDSTFGLVKWNLKEGGNKADALNNAAIAGPDNLRQVIKKLAMSDKDAWTRIKDNVWNLPTDVIEYFGKCVTLSAGFIYGLVKKLWMKLGHSFNMVN